MFRSSCHWEEPNSSGDLPRIAFGRSGVVSRQGPDRGGPCSAGPDPCSTTLLEGGAEQGVWGLAGASLGQGFLLFCIFEFFFNDLGRWPGWSRKSH